MREVVESASSAAEGHRQRHRPPSAANARFPRISRDHAELVYLAYREKRVMLISAFRHE